MAQRVARIVLIVAVACGAIAASVDPADAQGGCFLHPRSGTSYRPGK
jgi:hypothetical protein